MSLIAFWWLVDTANYFHKTTVEYTYIDLENGAKSLLFCSKQAQVELSI